MAWLEMSRDPTHGGHGWRFGQCLWSPTKRRGGGRWGYWELMRRVKSGDTVVHLRGKGHNASFVGFSTADVDCYVTNDRPPEPGEWEHATEFYRVPLWNFVPLPQPLLLESVFSEKRDELLEYHGRHSPASSSNGRYLFFVPQGGRLQCQNGAYLSEVDQELAAVLFGDFVGLRQTPARISVDTGQVAREMQCRIGQAGFSDAVRANFGQRCCFPECVISDHELIVGAHIARWADRPDLRGNIANGLALCLFHDRLFELGVFTVSQSMRICVNHAASNTIKWAALNVMRYEGQTINEPKIPLSTEALKSHWSRIGYRPRSEGHNWA